MTTVIHIFFVKGRISVRGDNNTKTINKKLTFKNNDPFRSYI